jgi:hypothetical protein
MTILEEVNASGGNDVIIRTLEITSAAWAEPILLATGFRDQVCTTEDGRTLTFRGVNMSITLPSKDNKGNQTLAFAIDNTTGEVSRYVDSAIEANTRATVIYRTFLSSNKSAPQERPYRLTILSGELKGIIAQLQCGYFNMIGTAWPRKYLTADYAPGLRYLV